MDFCILTKPNISNEKEIISYREEMLETKSSMDGAGPLRRMDNIKEWLDFVRSCENEQTVPSDWVKSEQFIYVRHSDKKILGMIQLRHTLNDFLKMYGGHIGYSVRPSERRKGYAKEMLAEVLKICKSFGYTKILITCIEGNEGSRRTIVANGGVYESTVYCQSDDVNLERYWIVI